MTVQLDKHITIICYPQQTNHIRPQLPVKPRRVKMNAKVINQESDKAGRHIREAIWIRKTENMNRDEGSYQLSHVWDKLLHTDDRPRKSVPMKASDVKPKRR